ncbi:hypothetical protein KPH14_013137, partial [Odynerus spinipes]
MIVDTRCNLSTSLRSWSEADDETNCGIDVNDTLGNLFDAINCATKPRNAKRLVMGEVCIRSEHKNEEAKFTKQNQQEEPTKNNP